MKRHTKKQKSFRQRMGYSTAPFFLHLPLGTLAAAKPESTADRVLVIVQLHGGNDGLNTAVPLTEYDRYQALRPSLALPQEGSRAILPLDSTVPQAQHLGLHPDLAPLLSLYEQGMVKVVQNVGYPNMSGSHFRSRDIVYAGTDASTYSPSGWAGRYLDYLHPNQNTPQETDPPAMELGTNMGPSLLFHNHQGMPMSLAINDMAQLQESLPPEQQNPLSSSQNSFLKELAFLYQINATQNHFARRLMHYYSQGKNTVEYPGLYPFAADLAARRNLMSPQLATIARLLAGGCRTGVFMVNQGGLDTHAKQVLSNDPTLGNHAAIIHNTFAAISAFMEDLKNLGLQDRVMLVTSSEFGRRPASNGALGTDHGTAAPLFVIGNGVSPGILGNNPSLQEDDLVEGNLAVDYDFRQVFASLLTHWLGAEGGALAHAGLHSFYGKRLPLVSHLAAPYRNQVRELRHIQLAAPNPNPVHSKTAIGFSLSSPQHIKLSLHNTEGQLIHRLLQEHRGAGHHQVWFNAHTLPNGLYVLSLRAGGQHLTQRLVVRK